LLFESIPLERSDHQADSLFSIAPGFHIVIPSLGDLDEPHGVLARVHRAELIAYIKGTADGFAKPTCSNSGGDHPDCAVPSS
jgi:hypothetical protein